MKKIFFFNLLGMLSLSCSPKNKFGAGTITTTRSASEESSSKTKDTITNSVNKPSASPINIVDRNESFSPISDSTFIRNNSVSGLCDNTIDRINIYRPTANLGAFGERIEQLNNKYFKWTYFWYLDANAPVARIRFELANLASTPLCFGIFHRVDMNYNPMFPNTPDLANAPLLTNCNTVENAITPAQAALRKGFKIYALNAGTRCVIQANIPPIVGGNEKTVNTWEMHFLRFDSYLWTRLHSEKPANDAWNEYWGRTTLELNYNWYTRAKDLSMGFQSNGQSITRMPFDLLQENQKNYFAPN